MSAKKLLHSNLQPLSQAQLSKLYPVLKEMDSQQLTWLSGYMAGLAQQTSQIQPKFDTVNDSIEITVLYGSQTGNARSLAQEIHSKLKQKSLPTKLVSMSDYRINQLKKEKWLVVVVSTHGNGEPPEGAINFYDQLLGNRAPKVSDLNFSVIGLGDSSYDYFCQTAKDLDQRLHVLGGKRFTARLDNDLDYEDDCNKWCDSFVNAVEPEIRENNSGTVIPLVSVSKEETSAWAKNNPYYAETLLNQKITSRNSSQDVCHIELSIDGSGLTYNPGDALGVVAKNDSNLINRILTETKLNASEDMGVDFMHRSLFDVLRTDYELTTCHPGFYENWLKLKKGKAISKLSKKQINAYLDGKQIIDVIIEHKNKSISALEFIKCLRKLTSRVYSISSSSNASENEVHITVAKVIYDAFGFKHGGHASTYLADEIKVGEKIGVYIIKNSHFRLPALGDTPIIMVSSGTGVAPFRSFIQQREFNGDKGKNWMFFGARHQVDDFLYQTEWLKYRDKGLLSHLDVAFSRDQNDKIYVQHIMKQKGKELFKWLENGAHIYICGSISMGVDVHETLKGIIQKHNRCNV